MSVSLSNAASPIVRPDSYYRDESIKALDAAIYEAQARGKTLDEIRFLIRRAYPFGALRKGRPYKIWRKLMLEKEAELGMEPRQYKTTTKRETNMKTVAAGPPTKQDLLKLYPVDKDSAAKFLRRYCRTIVDMREDHDKLRVVLKGNDVLDNGIKWQFTCELSTDDPKDWEAAFLAAAQAAHKVYVEIEADKF